MNESPLGFQFDNIRLQIKTDFFRINLALNTGHWAMFHTIGSLTYSRTVFFPSIENTMQHCPMCKRKTTEIISQWAISD